MTFTTPQNPWGLTQAEVDTLTALVQTGHSKLAARLRGCTQRTVSNHMISARKKMGATSSLMALLTWVRMGRSA